MQGSLTVTGNHSMDKRIIPRILKKLKDFIDPFAKKFHLDSILELEARLHGNVKLRNFSR